MIGEVLADLCLPRLMTVIVDCGIIENGDVSKNVLGSFVMSALFGEGPYGSMQVIVTFGILMLVIVLIGGTFGVSCAYFAAKAAQSMGNDLRCDAYRKVMSLSIEQTDRFTTGSLVTRMTNDISMIVEFAEMLLRMFVRSPIFFVGGTIMLISLEVRFGFVLLCGLPILALMLFLVLRKSVPLYSKIQKKLDRVNSVMQENVSGARVVKAYVKEDYEYERFKSANFELMSTNYRVQTIIAIINPVLTVVMNAAIIAIILIGGLDIRNVAGSGMTAGTIMAGITYVTQVLMSIMMISHLFQSVSRALSSVARVNEIMQTEPSIVGGKETVGLGSDVMVSFKNVGFRYPDTQGRPVLHGINLDIKRGETFAIIGATGCGKTSLVNLIPRFYDASEGEVLIDGRPIAEYDLSALRAKMSYVLQKSELFSGTVAENLRWGKENATDEELREAAEIAQADSFISSFTDSYDTFIAQKGASLSGGQKQRTSIARALLRKPEILILDDSTSALDLATEAKLRGALSKNLADTTVIIIAQRIASVRDADRIAIIEDGTVCDVGTHEYLLENSQTYRDIYASQNREGASANG
ncbi:MAG: ABC transporter ATP-binding protein [Clostridia bacterium]|nr:ABC transporter ATP-binding protein [Clostridia bacterium]MBR2389084.1 ABC transporter ATP-binding protein [Clostridia bacterium]